ncbi:uncharacterized protein EAE98_001705 [Botrytis deweyae]|uniref:DUF4470 domain-containing protein n=1 Tax=Botrytis deweyae TaxID=2478750 RepID=A0ABQ7IYU3_9HELO|nr:uncharacterized protein EAE98_001705 [Botrytis deweyae]KAF7937391.1 hypothetical protein EAE98_001705 [Botrytis deweyae]
MTSITLSEVEQADILRQEGNDLYKSSKLLRSITNYQESTNLVPDNCKPLGNLSTAYFEVGNYTQCIVKARRALQILGESKDNKNTDLVEKFQQRIKRAEIHSATAKEYCRVGNDKPASLFHHTIDKNEPVSSDVSFLFGGIGDARNLLQTIIGISELEKKHHMKKKQYHLTMVDVSNNTITRDLIISMLLEEYSNLEPSSEKAEGILSTLFYVFIAIIIPCITFNHLYRTIDRALSLLQLSTQPLSWMHLREEDFCLYNPNFGRLEGQSFNLHHHCQRTLRGDENVPTAFKKENKLYRATAVLIPPTRLLRNHNPAILALLQNRGSDPGKSDAALKKHPQPSPSEVKTPASLYDYIAPFFQDAARSTKFLSGRLQAEALCDDYVDFAEKLRFGLYRDENSLQSSDATASKLIHRKDFPVLYDRIHLTQQLTSVTVLSRGEEPWPMANYIDYGSSKPFLRQFGGLLSRKPFMKWFYALFFRLAIPYNSDLNMSATVIFSPLTLTIIFWLIAHLRSIGYPSH